MISFDLPISDSFVVSHAFPPVSLSRALSRYQQEIFAVRVDSGPMIRKKIEDFEKLYSKFKDNLPVSTAAPPKKKLLQADAKLQEKRRQWIVALSQTLLSNYYS
ncbi:hypothetical protein Y032_0953g3191 [Ancylostoma ceylanicum]|uniref:PX domain-containing protein n=1 Tax=Ancylostoma ceylanicum TaxID=53326 RepID=A0A016W9M1_9BILA|nr:hypothetical protein Y032_0953g3191 [Ancylostoma ceylanicum]